MDDVLRQRIASRWKDRARAEHASAVVMDTLADAVQTAGIDHHAAALREAASDERRHGDWCDRVVERLGATVDPPPVVPRTLPPARHDHPLAQTIEHVVFILCAGETLAEAALRDAAERATAPGIRDLMHTIANDEGRHGQIGWQVLDALVAKAPPHVRRALPQLLPPQAVRAALAFESLRPEPPDPESTAWGVPSTHGSMLARTTLATKVAPALGARKLWANPR